MKITEIETIALRLPYEERIRRQYYHFARNRIGPSAIRQVRKPA